GTHAPPPAAGRNSSSPRGSPSETSPHAAPGGAAPKRGRGRVARRSASATASPPSGPVTPIAQPARTAERGSGSVSAVPRANKVSVIGPAVALVSPPTNRRPNSAAQPARPS